MDNKVIADLINKYKDRINVGRRTVDDIVGFLKEKGTVEKITQSEITPSVLGNMIFNIKCSAKYKAAHPDEDEPDPLDHVKHPEKYIYSDKFNFDIYALLQHDKEIYEIDETDVGRDDDLIYIIFETTTETVYCNCSKLYLEIIVYRGISEQDYIDKTDELLAYLTRIKFIDSGWY